MSKVIAFPRPKVVSINSLKAKHLKALRYVEGYLMKHGTWPSFAEVQEALGIGSRLGAVRVVNQLFQLGAIERPSNLSSKGNKE